MVTIWVLETHFQNGSPKPKAWVSKTQILDLEEVSKTPLLNSAWQGLARQGFKIKKMG